MGLNIYFYNKRGDEVEYQEHLGITHNLNKIVDGCCSCKCCLWCYRYER